MVGQPVLCCFREASAACPRGSEATNEIIGVPPISHLSGVLYYLIGAPVRNEYALRRRLTVRARRRNIFHGGAESGGVVFHLARSRAA